MTLHTRREVLALAGAGMAAAAAQTGASSTGTGQAAPPDGEIQVRRTHADKRYATEPPLRWQSGGASGENVVRLDPGRTFQEVLGFGASFTDAACAMINRLAPPARRQLLYELFDPSGMAFSVARLALGSSDYATRAYSYDDGEADPELARFSIEHDRVYILPILLEARKVNPDLFLLGSPWSPPGWMKANNSMLGGSMRNKSLPVLRAVLREVPAGVRGRRGEGERRHLAERGGHRPGRPDAGLPVGSGVRDRVCRAPPRPRAREERARDEDLDSRSQLRPVGARGLHARQARGREVRGRRRLARLRRRPRDDDARARGASGQAHVPGAREARTTRIRRTSPSGRGGRPPSRASCGTGRAASSGGTSRSTRRGGRTSGRSVAAAS